MASGRDLSGKNLSWERQVKVSPQSRPPVRPAHGSLLMVNSPSHGIFSDISFSLLSSRETKETDVGLETLRLAKEKKANSQPCLEDESWTLRPLQSVFPWNLVHEHEVPKPTRDF